MVNIITIQATLHSTIPLFLFAGIVHVGLIARVLSSVPFQTIHNQCQDANAKPEPIALIRELLRSLKHGPELQWTLGQDVQFGAMAPIHPEHSVR